MRAKKIQFGFVVLTMLAAMGCTKKAAEKPNTDSATLAPAALNSTNLAEGMRAHAAAIVTPNPWAGYWFPYGSGGITGPAAKYDEAYLNGMRAQGRDTSNYESLASWEIGNHNAGAWKFEPWFGHCNGWSASALMVPEPRAPKTINGVTFDVADQKALLAESWLEFSGDFVGNRVNDKGDFSSAAFWDVVPGQFHLLLVNLVGKLNKGLIIDRHTGHEIWNQPLVAYKIDPVKPEDYLGPHPDFPAIYRVNMTASIWWANDNVDSEEITPPFDPNLPANEYTDHFYPGRVLHYELWLDGPVEFDAAGNMTSSGNILVTNEAGRYVGGVWKNGTSPAVLINTHPDYMWVPYGRQHSTGYKNPRIDDSWVRDNIASEEQRIPGTAGGS